MLAKRQRSKIRIMRGMMSDTAKDLGLECVQRVNKARQTVYGRVLWTCEVFGGSTSNSRH